MFWRCWETDTEADSWMFVVIKQQRPVYLVWKAAKFPRN